LSSAVQSRAESGWPEVSVLLFCSSVGDHPPGANSGWNIVRAYGKSTRTLTCNPDSGLERPLVILDWSRGPVDRSYIGLRPEIVSSAGGCLPVPFHSLHRDRLDSLPLSWTWTEWLSLPGFWKKSISRFVAASFRTTCNDNSDIN
jgi:hypothetical protein